MEPNVPKYMTPNFIELPHALIVDFANELMPLMNLMVEFSPYFTDRDYEQVVHSLFSVITYKQDIDFRLAEFSQSVMETYINPYSRIHGRISNQRLFEISGMLVCVGRQIYERINSMSGYIYGVFPYTVSLIHFNCEIYFKNVSMLNYDIELNHKPYSFLS